MFNIEIFEQNLSEQKVKPNTILAYCSDLRLFEQFCLKNGYISPDTVHSDLVSAFFSELEQQGKSPATVRRIRSCLNSYFRFLHKEGLTLNNPVKETRIAPKAAQDDPEILSHAEIDALMDYVFDSDEKGLRDKAILELLYASGIQIHSLLELRLDSYQPARHRLYAEGRSIPLYPSADQALRNYLLLARPYMAQKDENALFVSRQGTALSRQGLWKTLRQTAKGAGIEKNLTARLLRRSFAVHMLENGASPEDLEKLLGLSSKGSVETYIRLARQQTEADDIYRFHPRSGKQK